MVVVYGGADTPAYVIDDETLREEILDEDEAAEYVAEVGDHALAVAYLRMLGRLDEARSMGERMLLEREVATPSWAAAAVRLAHVHHWRGEYVDAHELLDAAEMVFAGSGPDGGADATMVAFVRQHRAKVLLDEGHPQAALEEAEVALEARRRDGDEALIASSEQVVAAILAQTRRSWS